MKISEICIKRPVFSTVLSLLIVLVGLISFLRLDVREYPDIDPPVITVTTTYLGASPEIMETEVTNNLEELLVSINGIDHISSKNQQGSSTITITFELDQDLETAANEVRDRVSRARGKLPKNVDEPIVAKTDTDSQPIMYLSISSAKHNALDLSYISDVFIKDKLQTIDGVASVNIFAERKYAIRISPDPLRMAARGITINDINNAIASQNNEFPAGIVEGLSREFSVLAKFDLNDVEQFKNVVVRQDNDYLLKIKDVADVTLGAENTRFLARFNGTDALAMGIVKQSVANPVDVAKKIRDALPIIEKSLPDGVHLAIPYDKTVFINSSIKAVYRTIIEALVLVVLIIFFFLRSFRTLIIPSIAIPVSLIGAFAFMNMFGFSINTFTLLALVLAIGLVVDDAIVVIENIYRHIEEGTEAKEAAFKGSNEIGFAIIAMTLTLAAVFIPIGFMQGETGKLFTEFAWTLALAVVISGFVALTLSPMMCSKLLYHEKKHGAVYNKIEKILNWINYNYAMTLDLALHNRKTVVSILGGVFLFGIILTKFIPSELAPIEDRGVIMGIFFAQEGSSLEFTNKYSKYLENIYRGVKEINSFFVVVGNPTVNQGVSFALLEDWATRKRSQMEIVGSLFPQMMGIPGMMAFPINLPSVASGGGDKPLAFALQSTLSYDELSTISNQFINELNRKYPWIINVESDLKMNQPRIELNIDRQKAALLGVDLTELGTSIQAIMGGSETNVYRYGGKEYNVIIQLDRFKRLSPSVLNNIYVRTAFGDMVRISSLVNIKEKVAPLSLNHYNRLRAVQITANIAQGYVLGDAIAAVDDIAKSVLTPEKGKYEYFGQSKTYLDSSYSTYVTFALALLFIYLVLSAQFESFKDPMIIMLTVPLSITGALLALFLTGGTLNIYSRIGLITLIGLITKNGILIVEFTNQLHEKGMSLFEATKEAAKLRLRPILMTTAATILGAIPLAIAEGPGSISRNNIGWVIVGGLFIGTTFTLYVIPVACLIFKGTRQE